MSQENRNSSPNKDAPTCGQPNKNNDSAKKKTLTFTFSVPVVVAICIGSVLTCVWIFIMGIVLGSGYKPEETIPHLSELMPQSEVKGQQPQIVTSDAPFGVHPVTPPEETPIKNIPAEELQYPNVLQNQRAETSTQVPLKRSVTVTSAPSTPLEIAPKKEALMEQNEQKNAKEAQTAKPFVTHDVATGELFDYVFQVASFPDMPSAEKMLNQLKRSGLQGSIEPSMVKGSTWYRCLVNFRGTADDVDILREKLTQHKLTQLLRRSKVAVQQ